MDLGIGFPRICRFVLYFLEEKEEAKISLCIGI
jgi:hypothetical protein